MTQADQEATEGFYLYGVVPAGTSLPDAGGMGEGGLLAVQNDDLAVVGEWIDVTRPLGRKRHLVAHSEVLNALALSGPALPLQFGTVVESEEAAEAEFLGPASDRLQQLLEQLRGYVQYVIRARYDEELLLAGVVQGNDEIAELRALTSQLPESEGYNERVRLGELVSRELEQRRAEDSAWLSEQLEGVVAGLVPHNLAGMDALAEFAACVSMEMQESFEAHLEDLAEQVHTWARLSLVGPMALYDFVPEE